VSAQRDPAPAAYHGAGWRPRTGSLAEDVAAGRCWSARANDSEYGTLREVVLHRPEPGLAPPADPDSVLHLAPADPAALRDELAALADCYEQLAVRVHWLDVRSPDGAGQDGPWHNLMFARDLFFMTPQGGVVARMGGAARAGEERHAARTLASLDVPVLRTVSGHGTFEGADALWARPDTVLVGLGRRTNREGARQLAECLAPSGVRVVPVRLPGRVQHLLGILQLVDRDLAVLRGELADAALRTTLTELGYTLVELDEDQEVARGQAMNFVTVAPRAVVMADDAPRTRRRLELAGLTVAGQAPVGALRRAAGGLACATGILSRRLTTPSADHHRGATHGR